MTPNPEADDVIARARVLVADDSALTREVTRRLLEEAGAEVTTVPDGVAAQRALATGAFHMVVTARFMPRRDGLSLVRAIRADAQLMDTYVLMLTGAAGGVAAAEALDAGADDYVVKSSSSVELVSRVRAGMRLVRARESVWAERDFSTGLVDAMQDGLLVVDMTGCIRQVNPRLAALLGVTAAELVGARPPYRFVHAADAARVHGTLQDVTTGSPAEMDLDLIRADGTRFPALMAASPLFCADTSGRAAVVTVKDLTRRRAREARLAESEERFAVAADAAPILMWLSDATGTVTFVNEELRRFVGMREPAGPEGIGWASLIHPDDLDDARTVVNAARRVGAAYTMTLRMRRHDGVWRSLTSTARPRHGPDGELMGFVGVSTDDTDRLAAERERAALHAVTEMVAAQETTADVLARVAAEICRLLDADAGGVARIEGDAAVVVGEWARVARLRRPVGTLIPLDGDGVTARVARTGRPARQDDYGDETGGDRRSSVGAPIRVDGAVWGVVGVAHGQAHAVPPDAEERITRFAHVVGLAIANAEAHERLALLAVTDPLTGLPNRRALEERVARDVASASVRDHPLAMAVIDIDHFKDVNDTHGHDVGDRVLTEVARRLGAVSRAEDPVARAGGEEFVWLMPGCNAEVAAAAAERGRLIVADMPFARVGTVTVSVGVAVWAEGESGADLFARADAAMYTAKQTGRNRVCIAPEGIPAR